MGTIVGTGAKKAPSTISVEEFNKFKKKKEKEIADLTAEKSALEEKIKELESKLEDKDSSKNDAEAEGKDSNKKAKKDE